MKRPNSKAPHLSGKILRELAPWLVQPVAGFHRAQSLYLS